MSTTFYSFGLDNWNSSYKGKRYISCVSWQFSLFTGILLLNLTNQFKDKHLETAYQRYSQRQRQKSLVILNIIDIVLKAIFLVAYMMAESVQITKLDNTLVDTYNNNNNFTSSGRPDLMFIFCNDPYLSYFALFTQKHTQWEQYCLIITRKKWAHN